MNVILSCGGFLAASLIIYISFQIGDDVESQVARMLGVLILLLSFLFGPLLIKLLMALAFFIVWPHIGDRLSLSFYRKLNK